MYIYIYIYIYITVYRTVVLVIDLFDSYITLTNLSVGVAYTFYNIHIVVYYIQ